jgi:serine/threonine protein kinase
MTVQQVRRSRCNFPASGRFPASESKEPSSSTPNAESVSHAHTSAHAAHAGEIVLGRYHLVRRIGAGGMGVVYLARDEHLERDVAVKRIAIELDRAGRGEREALAAARLSHPGIVALYESGRDEDAVYLVSELVRGRTLAELIGDGELSDRDVVLIGMTLCDALEHAHARGVVHRDVKPSNVICPDSNEDGAGVAKLTDFGIALMAGGDVLTRTGDIMGTLAYMAPEQAAGRGATGASDVYALGVVLYEGLSGINPIRAGNPAATARRVGTRLPALQRVRRDLPAGLCRAIDAAVMPEPEQRAGLGALRGALTQAVDAVADDAGPIATEQGFAKTARMRPGRPRRHAAAQDDPTPRDGEPLDRTLRRGEQAPPAFDDEAAGPLVRGRGHGFEDDRADRGRPSRARRHDFEAPEFDDAAGIRARRLRGRPPADDVAPDVRASQWRAGDARSPHDRGRGLEAAPRRRAPRWPLRAAAALAAAGVTAAALAWLGPQPPVQPAAASLAAGAVVLLLPRLGWLAMVATLLAWLAVKAPGIALLVAIAAAPVPLLMPRRGAAWSLPAAAPALGLVGLAGAWPALAGQARSWPARAALGALGGLWLVLAEALTSDRLLFGQPRDVLALPAWDGSALDAARDALVPIWSGGTLAIAALWALFAALLPLLVRGRSAALDLVATAGWAAALAAATGAVGEALMLDPPRGAVLGALAGGALAVGVRAARGRA